MPGVLAVVAEQGFCVGNSHLYLIDKTGGRPFRSSMSIFAPNCSLQRKSTEIGNTNLRQVNRSKKIGRKNILKRKVSTDFGYSMIHGRAI